MEVCISGQWGTVCNDGPTVDDGFDIDAARVVCRQLGLSEDGEQTRAVCGLQQYNIGSISANPPLHLDKDYYIIELS